MSKSFGFLPHSTDKFSSVFVPFDFNNLEENKKLTLIDKTIARKIKSIITEEKNIDQFGLFDEDPENPCVQSWVVSFIYEEGLYKEVISQECSDDGEMKVFTDLFQKTFSEVGGGFRPTLLLDYNENPDIYNIAEGLEGTFCDIEEFTVICIVSLAGELGLELSEIFSAWKEIGREDYIKAVKQHFKIEDKDELQISSSTEKLSEQQAVVDKYQEQLKLFVIEVKKNKSLQEKIKAAKDVDDVVFKIAKDAGFQLPYMQYRGYTGPFIDNELDRINKISDDLNL